MTPRHRAWIRDRRALGAAVLLGTAAAASAARAEPVRAVVELFTSQGCGACRSAEPVLRDLSRQPGVIALTLPVTYWDYLGWKDTLASRPLTERQRGYARGRGGRQVFTPQAVVDGSGVAVGSDRASLERLMRDGGQRGGLPVSVRSEARGDRIWIEIGAAPDAKADRDPVRREWRTHRDLRQRGAGAAAPRPLERAGPHPRRARHGGRCRRRG
jgi:hypothetical protein